MLQTRKFGPFPIDDSQSFAETKLSFAFVNIKPVVPGHVLISPHRVVPSFEELTAEEVTDLWYCCISTSLPALLVTPYLSFWSCAYRLLVQKVGKAIKPHFNAESLTFAVQVLLQTRSYRKRSPYVTSSEFAHF